MIYDPTIDISIFLPIFRIESVETTKFPVGMIKKPIIFLILLQFCFDKLITRIKSNIKKRE